MSSDVSSTDSTDEQPPPEVRPYSGESTCPPGNSDTVYKTCPPKTGAKKQLDCSKIIRRRTVEQSEDTEDERKIQSEAESEKQQSNEDLTVGTEDGETLDEEPKRRSLGPGGRCSRSKKTKEADEDDLEGKEESVAAEENKNLKKKN